MPFTQTVKAQNTLKDTLMLNDENIKDIVKYGARDSTHYNVKDKKAYLYGNAYVEMGESKLTAGMIVLDFKNNEVEAVYILDSNRNQVEYPVFVEGGETMTCHRMRMNMNTEKVYIEELGIRQDELYFNMGEAKRYPNDEIHLRKGRLTTCDQEDPHYHFQLSKGVVIPEKRIVTGPMNLWISGIPTPLGLPFAFIPQQEDRTSGILFPEFVPVSQYGFGIQNLGYFIPINDRLQTSVYVNLYSRGSWGLRNDLDYSKKYGYTGRVSMGFQQFNNGFPDYGKNNKVTLTWAHQQQAKSNPYWNFNSNVNFISDNKTKNNLDPINPQYFNNSFNSDVNVMRLFPGKPLTIGAKISMRQNAIAQNVSLISPIVNVNLTRVFPFQSLIKTPKTELGKSIQRIGLTYNLETQNKATFGDSLLSNFDYQGMGSQFFNGVSQGIGLQTTMGLLKGRIKITPNFSYGSKINFQQISKSYNPLTNGTQVDTMQKTKNSNEINFSMNATTVVYAYYKFIGKKKPILRHIMTPSIGYRYVPLLNELVSVQAGVNQATIQYSPWERSIYTVGNTRASSFLNFGINNSAELKIKSDKDTVTGYRKIRIIDQFSINGNYDFLKDSMPLSNLLFNLRMSPFSALNFVSSAEFSPYAWDSTGKIHKEFAYGNGQGLGRFLGVSLNTTFTLSTKKSKDIIAEKQDGLKTQWDADYNYFYLHPEQAIYFDIPWKVNVSHVFSMNANTLITATNPNPYTLIQTIALSGDLTFTKRWNLASNVNFDVNSQKITNMNLTLSRNMHCWALRFYWTPIGMNKSFLLSIQNTSSLFKDAKIELRKPPSFF